LYELEEALGYLGEVADDRDKLVSIIGNGESMSTVGLVNMSIRKFKVLVAIYYGTADCIDKTVEYHADDSVTA